VRKRIVDFLKEIAVKFALKKIFGAVIGGVQGFVVSFIVGKLWDKYLKPLFLWAFRKLEILAKRPFRKKEAEELLNANTNQDIDAAIDNLD
jgi:hypothetical protein